MVQSPVNRFHANGLQQSAGGVFVPIRTASAKWSGVFRSFRYGFAQVLLQPQISYNKANEHRVPDSLFVGSSRIVGHTVQGACRGISYVPAPQCSVPQLYVSFRPTDWLHYTETPCMPVWWCMPKSCLDICRLMCSRSSRVVGKLHSGQHNHRDSKPGCIKMEQVAEWLGRSVGPPTRGAAGQARSDQLMWMCYLFNIFCSCWLLSPAR